VVSGTWQEYGAMDSCHVEKRAHQKITPFRTPPPPIVKSRPVGGVRKIPSAIHRCACRWTVDLSAMFNQHSWTPPPPPTIKRRMVGGVWNSISTVDLGTDASAVQMRAFVIHDSGPPPPPPTVKGRTVGGGGGGGSGKTYQP
jgi:hypothetical protein